VFTTGELHPKGASPGNSVKGTLRLPNASKCRHNSIEVNRNAYSGISDTSKIPLERNVLTMNTLLIIAGVVAIVLLLVGGFTEALSWLLWVGVILLVVAAIGWLLSFMSGRRGHTV
jgi:hypothetical protein